VADIFISYTSSDRDWAFWIAKELEVLGHSPRIHEWEVNAGDDIYTWMEAQGDAADHVLCVVSDDYLKAPYSTLERNGALWRAAKQPGFALLVGVKPCKLPTISDFIRRCELFGVPEDAARLRLREFMQKREAPATAAFPGKVFAVSNIPIRVPEHFLGREDSLAAIKTALSRYEGRVAITALHGLRGVGKTTLAAAYAERHRGDYRATWWIRAQTADGLRADLVGLGVRLGWVPADEKEEPALTAVRGRLRHEGEGLLLIYDNALDAETLKPYLPPGGAARVLVTSNAHAWRGVAEPVEIRLWPKEIGADYLMARTGRAAERAAAEALSQALDGLPLAHEQAAAYCERLEVPLAEYLRRLESAPARMLDTARDAPAEYNDRLTVAKTFALAIDEAARLHPGAEPLIVHAALLFAIHEKVLGPEHINTERSLSNLAHLLKNQGELAGARPLFERALAICEKVLGPEHPDTARSLNNLACLLLDRGELADARPLFERALAIYEKVLGPEHPGTATSLANLASLLHKQGEWAATRPLFERALAICERCSAPSIPIRQGASTVSPAYCWTRASRRRHGRCSSARWRSVRRFLAPSTPTPRRPSATSPI
jgi:tetratricopeptide (TPR) repeat protein